MHALLCTASLYLIQHLVLQHALVLVHALHKCIHLLSEQLLIQLLINLHNISRTR